MSVAHERPTRTEMSSSAADLLQSVHENLRVRGVLRRVHAFIHGEVAKVILCTVDSVVSRPLPDDFLTDALIGEYLQKRGLLATLSVFNTETMGRGSPILSVDALSGNESAELLAESIASHLSRTEITESLTKEVRTFSSDMGSVLPRTSPAIPLPGTRGDMHMPHGTGRLARGVVAAELGLGVTAERALLAELVARAKAGRYSEYLAGAVTGPDPELSPPGAQYHLQATEQPSWCRNPSVPGLTGPLLQAHARDSSSMPEGRTQAGAGVQWAPQQAMVVQQQL